MERADLPTNRLLWLSASDRALSLRGSDCRNLRSVRRLTPAIYEQACAPLGIGTPPPLQWELTKTSMPAMSSVTEIVSAITRLPLKDAEELREWLEQWLEDQMEMTPDFEASIDRGKADLSAGRSRIVRP